MVRAGMRLAPALGVFLAAVAVGCGGGGGGGARGVIVDGGSGGNDGHLSGGETTAGTPAPGTTGGNTTSGGTTDPGSTGSGSTGSGSTAPGTTGGTAGGTTGAGSTDGTSAGSTGSGSNGSASGGGSTGGGSTGGTPPTGGTTVLRPNAIYFGHGLDPSLVSSVLPDGSDRRDEGGAGANVVAATPDTSRAGSYVYAAQVGSAVGLYRGTSFDPAASETLAAPDFDDVTSLSVAPDGAVAMVAKQSGRSRVFLVANGVASRIDGADAAAISPNGKKIAYSKPESGFDILCVWDRATGAVTRLVTGGDSLFPSFSKDGAWIVFSSNRDDTGVDAPWDLYQVPTAGGAIERLTDTPNLNEFGASYNAGRTALACVVAAPDPNANGVYVLSNTGESRIATDADLTLGTYWTDLAGRSLVVRGGRFQRLRLPKP